MPRILVGIIPYFVYVLIHKLLKGEQKVWKIVINAAAAVILFISVRAFINRLMDNTGGMAGTIAGLILGIILFIVLTAAVGKKSTASTALAYAGLSGAFTNTLFVMSGIYILYKDAYANAVGVAGDAVIDVIMGVVSFNGIVEAVVAAILIAGVGLVLTRMKPIKGLND